MKKKEIVPFLELKEFDEIQIESKCEAKTGQNMICILAQESNGLVMNLNIKTEGTPFLTDPILTVPYKKFVDAVQSVYAVNEFKFIPSTDQLIISVEGKKKQKNIALDAGIPNRLLRFEETYHPGSALWVIKKQDLPSLKSLEVSSAIKSIEQFAGITFSLKYPPIFLSSSSLALQMALPNAWSAYEDPAIQSDIIEQERILSFAYAKAISALPDDTVLRFYPDRIVAEYQDDNLRFRGQYPIAKAEYNIYSDILSALCQDYDSFYYNWFSTTEEEPQPILKELEQFRRRHKDEERTDLLVYLEPNQPIRFFSWTTKEMDESAWKWEVVKDNRIIDMPEPPSIRVSVYDFAKFLKGAEEGTNKTKSKKSKNSQQEEQGEKKQEGQLMRLKTYQNVVLFESQNGRGIIIADNESAQ